MGKQAGPTVEELEFIHSCFLRGLSDREVLDEIGDTEFPRRNPRFIGARRREFTAAKKVLEETTKKKVDPVLAGQRIKHLDSIVTLAERLRAELHLPSTSDIFSYPMRNCSRSGLSWKLPSSGADCGTVEVSLAIENDKEQEHLWNALLGHLATSQFSSIPTDFREWKKEVSQYLSQCYCLFYRVKSGVEETAGEDVPLDYKTVPGISVWFPLTICIEAADSSAFPKGLEYEHETIRGEFYGLKWYACIIAIAPSKDERNRYEQMHRELRAKYVQSSEAKNIAQPSNELKSAQDNISSELQRFGSMVTLPGHCDLCRLD